MKLAELKSRFKNKYVIRIIACVLVVAVVGSSATVYNVYAAKNTTAETETAAEENTVSDDGEDSEAEEDELETMLSDKAKEETKEIGKDETVYVIADSTGEAQSTIVSEWLKNPEGKDTLEDISDLKDITNVKGDETFTQKGSRLTWAADGKDIYYQGTSTKEIPVTEKLTYYLDGKKMEPEELAGKSGRIKIRFDYTNHEKTTVRVNGKDEEVYVPFVVVSGMLLNDNFTNVEVTNGKVVSNGSNDMVVGIAMPGLKDSLKAEESDFSEDISIPDCVEMTADVEDFELGMTMTVVTSSSDLSIDSGLDLSEMDEKVDDLTDASGQLKDGSGELADGLFTLKSSMGEFSNGMDSLQSGITAYTDGARTLADGLFTLKNQTTTLISGVSELTSSVDVLCSGVNALDQAVNTAMTDKEKDAARQQAVAAVDAQFADDSNSGSYHNIKAQAESAFYSGVTASKDAVVEQAKQQAQAAVQGQADAIAQQAKDAAVAQVSEQLKAGISLPADQQQALYAQLYPAIEGAVYAALSEQSGASVAELKADEATAAAVQTQAAAKCQETLGQLSAGMTGALTSVATEAAGAVADQTARSVSSQVASSVSASVASAVAEGVANQAKGTVGDAVAGAAKTAAETAAGQAAISGAESAKSLIASSIEKKDAKSGHSLVSGMNALNKAVNGMSGKMPELNDGIDQLYTGSQTLVSKNDELNNGMAKLADGKNQVVIGVDKLAEGSRELADGMIKFDEEGIEKLADSYNGDVKELVSRIQAVMDAGSGYESFGGKTEATAGSVKFVIKTDGVKAEE